MSTIYVLDANVFISSKKGYYAFDIAPGFWKSLVYHAGRGTIVSIDKVLDELLDYYRKDELVKWAKGDLPMGFFRDTSSDEVVAALGQVMRWIDVHPMYNRAAKTKFADKADSWLVAFALEFGLNIVTNEQPDLKSKSVIKIPDVCNEFNVPYINTFELLKRLKIQLDWEAPR